MPEPKDVHQDAILTNIAVQYRNASFIADEVLPVLLVNKKSDKFYIYNKPDRFNIHPTVLAPKAEANEVDWGLTEGTYSCTNHALRDLVTREEEDNADSPITPRIDTVEFLTDIILLAREKRVADLLMGDNTPLGMDSVDTPWDSTGDPVADIEAAKKNMFLDPNTIVIPRSVFSALKGNKAIIDRIKYSVNKVVTPELLAELFEVERVLVATSRYNSAKPGQAPVYQSVWPDRVLLAYITAPGVKKITLGQTFRWNLPGSNQGWSVRAWDEPKRGIRGGTMIQVEHSDDEKVICADAGYVLSGVLTSG
jgi:hypothetical protein